MKRITYIFPLLLSALVFTLALQSCQPDDGDEAETLIAEQGERYSGGENFTSFDVTDEAFGRMGNGLSSAEETQFGTGNFLFRSNWVTAPASVMTIDGLGPIFNAISCGSCHNKDGRAEPPGSNSGISAGLLFRLSIPGASAHGEPLPEPNYGGQFQDRSILSVLREGVVDISYIEVGGQYLDGTPYSLRKPVYNFADLNYGAMHNEMEFSPRIAQQIPGLGLLESVDESTLLALADEADANGDGISGRANYVWNYSTNNTEIGRFGWKANQPTLRQQAAAAFNGDMGITSTVFTEVDFSPAQSQAYGNLPNGGEPEINDENLAKVMKYLETLAVPARREWENQEVLRGKNIFNDLNCSGCHAPKMQTGNSHPVAALRNQTIRPYTDLLLHDMGTDLADNRLDFLATGSEWRTPPLWGIGLIERVSGHTTLLHDGRARNVEEAILWHGGEAATARDDFKSLSITDRNALLRFIGSL